MTLTSVGYGDIVPQNETEYFLCTILMLMCGFVWAYVVASVVNVCLLDPKPYIALQDCPTQTQRLLLCE
eukprot:2667868-Amphidinium_carterae.1